MWGGILQIFLKIFEKYPPKIKGGYFIVFMPPKAPPLFNLGGAFTSFCPKLHPPFYRGSPPQKPQGTPPHAPPCMALFLRPCKGGAQPKNGVPPRGEISGFLYQNTPPQGPLGGNLVNFHPKIGPPQRPLGGNMVNFHLKIGPPQRPLGGNMVNFHLKSRPPLNLQRPLGVIC